MIENCVYRWAKKPLGSYPPRTEAYPEFAILQ
jgi:hypothetical protein